MIATAGTRSNTAKPLPPFPSRPTPLAPVPLPAKTPTTDISYSAWSPSPSEIEMYRTKRDRIRHWTAVVPNKAAIRHSELSDGVAVAAGTPAWITPSPSDGAGLECDDEAQADKRRAGSVLARLGGESGQRDLVDAQRAPSAPRTGNSTKSATPASSARPPASQTLPVRVQKTANPGPVSALSTPADQPQRPPLRYTKTPPVPLLAQAPAPRTSNASGAQALQPHSIPLPRSTTYPSAPGSTRSEREAYLTSALSLPLEMLAERTSPPATTASSQVSTSRLGSLLGRPKSRDVLLDVSHQRSGIRPEPSRANAANPKKLSRSVTHGSSPVKSTHHEPIRLASGSVEEFLPAPISHAQTLPKTWPRPHLTSESTLKAAIGYPLPAITVPSEATARRADPRLRPVMPSTRVGSETGDTTRKDVTFRPRAPPNSVSLRGTSQQSSTLPSGVSRDASSTDQEVQPRTIGSHSSHQRKQGPWSQQESTGGKSEVTPELGSRTSQTSSGTVRLRNRQPTPSSELSYQGQARNNSQPEVRRQAEDAVGDRPHTDLHRAPSANLGHPGPAHSSPLHRQHLPLPRPALSRPLDSTEDKLGRRQRDASTTTLTAHFEPAMYPLPPSITTSTLPSPPMPAVGVAFAAPPRIPSPTRLESGRPIGEPTARSADGQRQSAPHPSSADMDQPQTAVSFGPNVQFSPSSPSVDAIREDDDHVSFEVPSGTRGRLRVSLAWLRDASSPRVRARREPPAEPSLEHDVVAPPVPPKPLPQSKSSAPGLGRRIRDSFRASSDLQHSKPQHQPLELPRSPVAAEQVVFPVRSLGSGRSGHPNQLYSPQPLRDTSNAYRERKKSPIELISRARPLVTPWFANPPFEPYIADPFKSNPALMSPAYQARNVGIHQLQHPYAYPQPGRQGWIGPGRLAEPDIVRSPVQPIHLPPSPPRSLSVGSSLEDSPPRQSPLDLMPPIGIPTGPFGQTPRYGIDPFSPRDTGRPAIPQQRQGPVQGWGRGQENTRSFWRRMMGSEPRRDGDGEREYRAEDPSIRRWRRGVVPAPPATRPLDQPMVSRGGSQRGVSREVMRPERPSSRFDRVFPRRRYDGRASPSRPRRSGPSAPFREGMHRHNDVRPAGYPSLPAGVTARGVAEAEARSLAMRREREAREREKDEKRRRKAERRNARLQQRQATGGANASAGARAGAGAGAGQSRETMDAVPVDLRRAVEPRQPAEAGWRGRGNGTGIGTGAGIGAGTGNRRGRGRDTVGEWVKARRWRETIPRSRRTKGGDEAGIGDKWPVLKEPMLRGFGRTTAGSTGLAGGRAVTGGRLMGVRNGGNFGNGGNGGSLGNGRDVETGGNSGNGGNGGGAAGGSMLRLLPFGRARRARAEWG